MFAKSKLLRIFAQETFGEEKYYPVFHGEMKTTKPFALVVKRPRCIWKRPFAKTEFVILDGLEKYVKTEEVHKFLDEVKKKVTPEDLTELKNTSGRSGHRCVVLLKFSFTSESLPFLWDPYRKLTWLSTKVTPTNFSIIKNTSTIQSVEFNVTLQIVKSNRGGGKQKRRKKLTL